MKNVLIISGHTNLAASVANKTILETLNERLPEAEIVKLDELYPDFKIDVEAEQQKLLRADIIVLQFPLFWYSAPSILERWMEETFRLTHMEYSGSVYTCGVSYGNRTTPELIEQQRNISVAHTERLIELLETL